MMTDEKRKRQLGVRCAGYIEGKTASISEVLHQPGEANVPAQRERLRKIETVLLIEEVPPDFENIGADEIVAFSNELDSMVLPYGPLILLSNLMGKPHETARYIDTWLILYGRKGGFADAELESEAIRLVPRFLITFRLAQKWVKDNSNGAVRKVHFSHQSEVKLLGVDEQVVSQEPEQPVQTEEIVEEHEVFTHSQDYTTVTIRGQSFVLSKNQAKCIKILHEALKQDPPWLSREAINQKIRGGKKGRVPDLFRDKSDAYKALVDSPHKGKYRLNV